MSNLDHVILKVSYQYFLDVVLILVINDCTHSSTMCSMIFHVLYVVSCCHMLFSKDKVTFLAPPMSGRTKGSSEGEESESEEREN